MLTHQEAQRLRGIIQQEAPQVEIEVAPELGQPGYYYLIIYLNQQPRFVVRSLDQWNTRKKTLQ
jgi:hypothetical protein